MQDDKEILGGGAELRSSGFLPATYQGTLFRQGDTPILNLKPPAGNDDAAAAQQARLAEEAERDLVGATNKTTRSWTPARAPMSWRIRCKSAAPEAVDLTKESDATKKLYGMDEPETAVYGANCLMARRLVERGVRFVEVYSGSGSGWDAHQDVEENHTKWCQASDKPVAGLLTDLKARGMLKDTLVVWGGEFGRTVRAGSTRQTPEIRPRPQSVGLHHVDGGRRRQGRPDHRHHRRNRPARAWRHRITCTISTRRFCTLLGLDHLQTTYMHNGRAERPTVVAGQVIEKLFA